MAKRLIVNADDLGISAGVNQGILEVHQRGIVTSTTAMVNLPDAGDGIRLLQREAPDMGIGLHLNLTRGQPVLPVEQVSSLVQADGIFYGVEAVLSGELNFSDDELAAEIMAQYDRFVELAGGPPDHIDSHHGTAYHLPATLDVLLQLATEHHLPLRNGVRRLKDPAQQAVYDRYPAPCWPDQSEYRFYDDTVSLDILRMVLNEVPEGITELICHPGYARDLDEAYNAPREDELRCLTDSGIRQLIEDQRIELVTFAALNGG
jgi:predicted glycoside hydrolase/deacetylase ChbG (UPF0249 family)